MSVQKSRKHVTQELLHGLPEPQEGQLIVRTVKITGHQIFEAEAAQGDEKDAEMTTILCRLPRKFNKLAWIKPGTFLLVEEDNAIGGKAGKVKWQINHILMEKQQKHLIKKGLWPAAFLKEEREVEEEGLEKLNINDDGEGYGGEYSDDDTRPPIHRNTNRRPVEESSDDEPSSEEED